MQQDDTSLGLAQEQGWSTTRIALEEVSDSSSQ
jgi:hypothetical protein